MVNLLSVAFAKITWHNVILPKSLPIKYTLNGFANALLPFLGAFILKQKQLRNMAPGKNSRGDGRNLSNYCSTVPVAVFVAFCLVGIWIVMSSIVPVQDSVMQVSDTIIEVQNIANQTGLRQFEDKLGDIQEESARRDTQTPNSQSESNPENQDDQNETEKVFDTTAEDHQQEVIRDISGRKNDLEKGLGNKIEGSYQVEHVKETSDENKSDESLGDSELGTENSMGEVAQQDEIISETEEERIKQNPQSNMESHENSLASKEGTSIEASTKNGAWSTQAAKSWHDKKSQKSSISIDNSKYEWKLCNTTSGSDYIPCLDNLKAIRKLRSISHYQHRERHCPDEVPTCLVSLPKGYRSPIRWPKSREMVCSTKIGFKASCYLLLKFNN